MNKTLTQFMPKPSQLVHKVQLQCDINEQPEFNAQIEHSDVERRVGQIETPAPIVGVIGACFATSVET